MPTNNIDSWIQTGYEIFANEGLGALKIEPLSKLVGKSKSSFYHHFADLEIFMERLLAHHLHQSSIIAHKEKTAKTIDPDLIHILIEHSTDLLFNRQLRIHQNIKHYSDTLNQSNIIIGDAFKLAWAKDLNVQLTPKQLESVFTLALENFYLQINKDTLNYTWLSQYFANLKKLTNNFI